MVNLSTRLKLGSSLAAFLSAMPLVCGPVLAQTSDADALATVVVTGSSIRGVSPIGSNLMTMDQTEI